MGDECVGDEYVGDEYVGVGCESAGHTIHRRGCSCPCGLGLGASTEGAQVYGSAGQGPKKNKGSKAVESGPGFQGRDLAEFDRGDQKADQVDTRHRPGTENFEHSGKGSQALNFSPESQRTEQVARQADLNGWNGDAREKDQGSQEVLAIAP